MSRVGKRMAMGGEAVNTAQRGGLREKEAENEKAMTA